jgi:plasmid stabilization system protein ParE
LKPLEIIAPAERELREATEWYRVRDPRVAEQFAAEVNRIIELIQSFPQISSLVAEVRTYPVRRTPLQKFPYHIVFVELRDQIKVVAAAHNRRNPIYFIGRLRRL